MKDAATRKGHTIPVLTVCLVLLVVWYIACIPLNAVVAEAKIAGGGGRTCL